MPTGHYKFRSAFGNVGRLFKGARIGDPSDESVLLTYNGDQLVFNGKNIVMNPNPGSGELLFTEGSGISMNEVGDNVEISTI